MRFKSAMGIVALGFLAVGALFVLHVHNKPSGPAQTTLPAPAPTVVQESTPAQETAPVAQSASLKTQETNSLETSRNTAAANPATPNASSTEATKAAQEAYVSDRISTLMNLAMDNARSSLDTILSELTNSNPEIRKGALEATIQFASRDAIPRLAEVAAQTQDTDEQAALNDAIEFLKLPSLTELTEANKGIAPVRQVKAARPGVPAVHPPGSVQQ